MVDAPIRALPEPPPAVPGLPEDGVETAYVTSEGEARPGWGRARAIGADETLDSELEDFTYGFVAPQIDGWRNAGVLGPRVELAAGADRQSALLAITGRDPR